MQAYQAEESRELRMRLAKGLCGSIDGLMRLRSSSLQDHLKHREQR